MGSSSDSMDLDKSSESVAEGSNLTNSKHFAPAPNPTSSFEFANPTPPETQRAIRKPIHISKYIPVGCIRVSKAECEITSEIWKSCDSWSAFVPAGPAEHHQASRVLANALQDKLFKSPVLRLCLALHNAGWIRMEFKTNDIEHGQARVYILPDDFGRSIVDRSQPRIRKSLAELISKLDVSMTTWTGRWTQQDTFIPLDAVLNGRPEDESSLFFLFNNLPSPNPDSGKIKDRYYRQAMTTILSSDMNGLDTILYKYQRRSAALMLQKESQPMKTLDPRLTILVDQKGSTYYCDFNTSHIYQEQRTYEAIKGGILAETMGLGKTLICLSLILATKDLISETPPEYSSPPAPVRRITGSLRDIAASTISRYSWWWKKDIDQLEADYQCEFVRCRVALDENPGYYYLPPPVPRRVQRQVKVVAPRKIWLSHATLVVVPPNLVQQWRQEINKHTLGLKALVLTDLDARLPGREELLSYDILLFSKARFEKEVNALDHHVRLRDFHFKRLIVDEGHTFGNSAASSQTQASMVVDSLQVSAKWIVSGTPTRGLYGVDSAGQLPTPPSESFDEMAIVDRMTRKSLAQDIDLFNKREREDLEKLGNIATYFLKARPWANTWADGDPASWNELVMQPRHGSNSRGNMACLRATLDGMIIRHRPGDVVGDVVLPPLHQKTVLLEGSVQNKLSLNTFALMIITNAVTSERKDADYFFHPKQRKNLMLLVSNLRQASFFWSGFEEEHIASTIGNGTRFLEKGEVQVSPEDDALLRQALKVGEAVLNNDINKRISYLHEMPFYIQNRWPEDVQKAWSLDREGGDPTLIAAALLIKAQKYIMEQLQKQRTLDGLATFGMESMQQAETAAEEAAEAAEEAEAREASAPSRRKSKSKVSEPTLAGGVSVGEASKSRTWAQGASSANANQRVKAQMSEGETQSQSYEAGNAGEGSSSRHPPARANIDTPSQKKKTKVERELQPEEKAALESTHIISTASAKLSYLMDKISEYQAAEKIIVFYEAENTAYYIAQALECLGIEHLIYAKSLSTAKRAQYVVSFNQSSVFRVLLMDVGQAAYGLDISSASRVFFVNPVFSPQVEAQAVKRAHRIGQTRPVYVETLVLKGSIEEVIIDRRAKMTSEEHHRCKNILDDQTMYDWIKNVGFIDVDTDVPGTEQMSKLESARELMGVEEYAVGDRHLVAQDESAASFMVDKGKGKRRADSADEDDGADGSKKVRFA